MGFLPKIYTTKNDQTLLIREAISDDAKLLINLKLEYLKNTATLPLFEDEYPNDVKEEREMIQRYHSETNSILLVAIFGDEIIGNIDLTGSWRKKMQHTAMIGMGIHTQWQNQGVGTLLLKNTLEWTKENEFLKTVWLEVYATNHSGITLYQKMGFIKTGIIPQFFCEDGLYIDKIIMSKIV